MPSCGHKIAHICKLPHYALYPPFHSTFPQFLFLILLSAFRFLHFRILPTAVCCFVPTDTNGKCWIFASSHKNQGPRNQYLSVSPMQHAYIHNTSYSAQSYMKTVRLCSTKIHPYTSNTHTHTAV